ncbi:hypothetical protein MAE02_46520 [Microvirga aerophila]|uniref:Uncharacterized protein n=1 Tax=Microvirga aerophila TaxID=670291 RepID=A0A512BYB7_9HYPH|nr:hypothetical protein MAE02_46520 [Microvirga aerophila]
MLRSPSRKSKALRPADIAAAFWGCGDLLARETNELVRLGVPVTALTEPFPVRVGYVVFDELGFRFKPRGINEVEGVRAFLFLITDKHGEVSDIVAWAPMVRRLSTWLNRASALGEEAVGTAHPSSQSELRVWPTPLEWLQAGREGLCFIRPAATILQFSAGNQSPAKDGAGAPSSASSGGCAGKR